MTAVENAIKHIFDDLDQENSLKFLAVLCFEDRCHALESINKGFLTWIKKIFVELLLSPSSSDLNPNILNLSLQVLNGSANHVDFIRTAFYISENCDSQGDEYFPIDNETIRHKYVSDERISVELLCCLIICNSLACFNDQFIVLLVRVLKSFPVVHTGI